MDHRAWLPILTLSAASSLFGQDPAETDSDKYRVILENDRTRVLDYRDRPGTKTAQHRHPESVLYALSAFDRRLTFPDGTTKMLRLKPGDVFFLPAQVHIGENIGKTDTHIILVEFKSPSPPPDSSGSPKK
jgi:quercetin dioxygenase-like cupin family protein